MMQYRAEEFKGTVGDNPTKAEYWLLQLDRIFGFMNTTVEKKLQCAVALLKDEAYEWWASVLHAAPPASVNWEFFLSEFRKRYVGGQYLDDRRQEFLQLKQGKLTVLQYETEFRRLSRYAREIVPSEGDLCRRFRGGLKTSVQKALLGVGAADLTELSNLAQTSERLDATEEAERQAESRGKRPLPADTPQGVSGQSGKRSRDFRRGDYTGPTRFSGHGPNQRGGFQQRPQTTSVGSAGGDREPPACQTCGSHHYGECRKLTGRCFRCGSPDHFLRDCPRPASGRGSQAERSAPTTQRGGRQGPNGGAGRGRGGGSQTFQRTEQRAPARTYAIGAREDQEQPDVSAD